MPTLDFKGKQHVYAHHLTVPYRSLVREVERSEGDDTDAAADGNLIIHGDNLHALKALLPRYAGKVNCIYIDPLYNTGNEGWRYNDNVNSSLMREWLVANSPVDGEDLERHDKWLCMMWPRLHLLRELLSNDGAIFVSIDDHEQHHLRMLMDEIFGDDNFVANITWRKKAGGGQDSKYLAREHDYILCYRKSQDFSINFRSVQVSESEFRKTKNGRRCKFIKLEKWGSGAYRTDRPTLFYPIKDPDGNDFYPQAPNGQEGRWRTRPEALDDDHIYWEKRNGRWTPHEVKYFDEATKVKTIKERTVFYDMGTTTDAAKEQRMIFGNKVLDNSKPVDLIYRILAIGSPKDGVILDSFAGSGTTAHAVLALNSEDGGNRKFILVECEDYADTITAERVRRVIEGVPKAKDDDILKEGLGGSFTYCTLGKAIDVEEMLNGKNLPEYSELASYLLYTASGLSFDKSEGMQAQTDEGLFWSGDDVDYYLLYRPDIEWLRSNEALLNEGQVWRISERGKKAVVFAAGKHMGQHFLTDKGITFCQIPYEMHRLG
ncbi:MAG: site-specific DNA-methyltransferase [Caldilineaceae bacterium SB0661_bin_34]|nr:site-specific DNA-methyltransferase [Caldilineaceae bacterium SB0661_bin_34]